MANTWDIVSSTLTLLFFLGIVYAVVKVSGFLNQSSTKARTDLSKHGVTYENGKLRVKTDRAAPTREEYIASTQRAFEKGAHTVHSHPEAFRTSSASSSAVETSEKKGFQRGKKLA